MAILVADTISFVSDARAFLKHAAIFNRMDYNVHDDRF